MVEQGGMLDTVLEHVVTVTMDEEGEEMEQREVSHPSDVFRVRAAVGPAQHSSEEQFACRRQVARVPQF